jgi:hypothetical protein
MRIMMAADTSELAIIEKLPLAQQSNYVPYLLGNDTPLTNESLAPYRMNKNFVLIGTALFRSIDIACNLAQNDTTMVPTVVIIDTSRNTSIAWQQIQALFAAAPPTQDYRKFLYDEDGFLSLISDLMDQKIIYADDNIPNFFLKFFQQHSFAYVQQMMAKLEIIEQDWAHADTFSKLKMIYYDSPVVAYSSNIIDFVAPETQIQILRNLEHLNPCVSLCTNFDKIKRAPTMSYVFTDSSPLTICEALQLSDSVKSGLSRKVDTIESQYLEADQGGPRYNK